MMTRGSTAFGTLIIAAAFVASLGACEDDESLNTRTDVDAGGSFFDGSPFNPSQGNEGGADASLDASLSDADLSEAAVPQDANFTIGGYAVDSAGLLVRFSTSAPGSFTTVAITGLMAGETILGLDQRPSSGVLFAVGSANRLYTVAPTTGVATLVGAGAFTPTLSGTNFGVDFNPVADLLRVVSDTGQNLRLSPTGAATIIDSTLAYAVGDAHSGTPAHVTASAYLGDNGAVATTLYEIDTSLDALVTQNPPNNGTLNTVGSLGVNLGDACGFDIRTENTSPVGYVVGVPAGTMTSTLFAINLTTGALTSIGVVGGAGVTHPLRAFALAR